MSIPIIYESTDYIAGQHIFKTILNGTNLSLITLANTPTCNVMTIVNANVGIGTTIPLKPFHVQGDIYTTGNLGIGTTIPLQPFHVQGNIYSSGNLGIGTTIPLQPFHVQGDIYTTGNLGIGTTNPQATLDIRGRLYCPGMIVQTKYYYRYNSTTFLTGPITAYTATGISVNITPYFATSTILITMQTTCDGTSTGYIYGKIYKNGTAITTGNMINWYNGNANVVTSALTCNYVESPNTTSTITYDVRIGIGSTAGRFGSTGTTTSMIVQEIA